jgi:hypothetical protein
VCYWESAWNGLSAGLGLHRHAAGEAGDAAAGRSLTEAKACQRQSGHRDHPLLSDHPHGSRFTIWCSFLLPSLPFGSCLFQAPARFGLVKWLE